MELVSTYGGCDVCQILVPSARQAHDTASWTVHKWRCCHLRGDLGNFVQVGAQQLGALDVVR